MILHDGTILLKTGHKFEGKPTYSYYGQDIYGLIDELVKALEHTTTPGVDGNFCYQILKAVEES